MNEKIIFASLTVVLIFYSQIYTRSYSESPHSGRTFDVKNKPSRKIKEDRRMYRSTRGDQRQRPYSARTFDVKNKPSRKIREDRAYRNSSISSSTETYQRQEQPHSARTFDIKHSKD